MEEYTWKTTFARELHELEIPDQWNLCFDMNLEKQYKGRKYTQKTFGSFRCSSCSRIWNSSKVCILFLLNNHQSRGTVRMRIFKQGCESCTCSEGYPKITHENVARVVSNLVNHIQKKFYEVDHQYHDLKANVYGKLEGPHNQELCEACKYGLCEQSREYAEKAFKYGLCEQSREYEKKKQESASSSVLTGLAVGAGVVALMCLASSFLDKKNKK